ncbi:MAG TPA: adenylate/guanylate cyclase domain-containing protein [Puia sp.]|nr:adenylate/guanylate cyclase domain-containing protein [Puia sp.]
MAKINLQNILNLSGASALISTLVEQTGADIFIENEKQKVVFGIRRDDTPCQIPVKVDEEIIGWVKGDHKAEVAASFLNLLVQKESERKKLGSEVLMLYQEVNLIFNFSERLAQTIGNKAVADITLEEARRLIKSDAGIVLLWDEQTNQFEVLSSSGQSTFDERRLQSSFELLRYIAHSGQSEIVEDVSVLKDAGLVVPEVQSLIYAALKVNHRVMGAIVLASTAPVQYSAADLKFLITLALQSSSAIESALLYERNIREVKEKEEAMRKLYEITNKFVPHEFIKSLGKKIITDVKLGDLIEKIVTVLFIDIRDYTTLSENMTPEENFVFIGSFNEKIGPIIRQHEGFINQYLGDAIMAIFPSTASYALDAAIKMQRAVREFNVSRMLRKKPPIKIGIGLHTGPLIMGITGDHQRLDATTIADTVNTASRLEALTKHYKSDMLVSGDSLKTIREPEQYHFRHLGLVQLKGKNKPIAVYECFDGADEINVKRKLSSLALFNAGVSDYLNKSFADATAKFDKVLEIHPDDMTTKMFLGNANHYITNGVPENWTGVEKMHSK